MNIEAKELSKIYGSGESRVVALDKVNLEIASSDFISRCRQDLCAKLFAGSG